MSDESREHEPPSSPPMEEMRAADRFEATFVVDVPIDDAWSALAESRRPSDLPPPSTAHDPGDRWLPGFDSTGEDLEVVPGRRLRVRKKLFPCEGTEILVELERTSTGTKVTVVQSGFGTFWDVAGEALVIGGRQIVADLAAFLETGIVTGRHTAPWTPSGCAVRSTASGLRVRDVQQGSYAERAGLRTDDLLVSFAGAPLVDGRDLATLERVVRPGVAVTTTWVRGRRRMEATASL